MINQSVHRGLKWLVDSDIRIKDQSSPLFDSVCGSYNTRNRSYPFVYCEITAYAIQFLLRAAKWFQNKDLVLLAKAGGDFLMRTQHNESDCNVSGAIPYGFSLPDKQKIEKYYSFDSAICMSALVELYEVLGDESYLKSAIRICTWLEVLQEQSGFFHFGHTKDGYKPKLTDWYGSGGCLHAKNAIGLLKLYNATQERRLVNAAERVLEWGLTLQLKNGAFRVNKECNYIFTHACCYAIEGLLYGYSVLGKPHYLRACIHAASWLLGSQNSDGSLSQYYGPNIECYLADIKWPLRKLRKVVVPRETGATAQAMRIWLALYRETGDKAFDAAAHKAGQFILRMQSQVMSDPNSFGGFHSSCDSLWLFHRLSHYQYAWTDMFACHALNVLDDKTNYPNFNSIVDELF
ncbi:MAG: hypothetical protein NTX75_03905 [Proteobacteria bacterium]|nr:hypothetical protein [Pseudomonadota bacterium]